MSQPNNQLKSYSTLKTLEASINRVSSYIVPQRNIKGCAEPFCLAVNMDFSPMMKVNNQIL